MTVITAEVLDEQKKEPLPTDQSTEDLLPEAKVPAAIYQIRHSGGSWFTRPRNARMRFCILYSVLLLTLAISAIFGYSLYQFYRQRHTYRGMCKIMMPGENHDIFENIEMDQDHETVQVPNFRGSSRSVTILHAFSSRLTLIKTDKECLLKPMREDLRLPRNMAELFANLQNGKYVPQAKFIRAHWYVLRPEIPLSVYENYLPTRMTELCRNRRTFQLAPLDRYAEQKSAPVLLTSSCQDLDCHTVCPVGFVRTRHPITDCVTCTCQDGFGFCAGEVPCAERCSYGYRRSEDDCKLCQCKVVAERKRRSVEQPQKPKEVACPLEEIITEGFSLGDLRAVVPLNYIHNCGRVASKDGLLA